MGTPRAYCKTALLHDKLYAVGGVNRGHAGLTPLQSAEVYEPTANTWTPIRSMPFTKAQVLPTAFLADMLKPIATGMASYKGKLFVPQSLYSWPFFVDVGGEVFDPVSETWSEMPRGCSEKGSPAAGPAQSFPLASASALSSSAAVSGSFTETESEQWKTIARKNFGSVELVTCQVLDV
ncbi:hypothetical protein GOP47_0007138 [Adiantum capillus-veneris]|uniref:Uncharacterized protein n=1 Tax=Adiantum capillus-veneris TaxID=13818 RepID=A0A9D4V0E3_ADICA|nr:hypothetical protein GOP47_0007138 [Adiantum capillus-veneris]